MQNKVKEFNDNKGCHKTPMPVYARLLDISSEMGELAKEYLKNSNYGTHEFIMSDDFKEEFGDCLYALLSLANEVNVNSEECLTIALDKLEKRMKNKNDMGSGR